MRILLAIMLLLPSLAFANTRDNLAIWWKLDEASGNASDSSWNGYTGTVTGGTVITNCPKGKCRNLTNVDTIISSGFPNFGLGAFTASYWMKTTTAGTYVLSKRVACGGESFWNTYISGSAHTSGIEVDDDIPGTNYLALNATTVVDDGKWHMTTFTRSGVTVSAYVDGVFNASGATGATTNISNVAEFGINNSTCTGLSSGQIDDVRIYNRALSAQEIKDLYNSGMQINHVPYT